MSQRHGQARQCVMLGLKYLEVDLVDLLHKQHWVVKALHALAILDVGCDYD